MSVNSSPFVHGTWFVNPADMSHGRHGFWSPHSATIDFCERNYEYSEYVCEWWNVCSALVIVAAGAIGYFHSTPTYLRKGSTGEKYKLRFVLIWTCLSAVGLGSVGLHGSLVRWLQATDELPMLLLNSCMIYALDGGRTDRLGTITLHAVVLGVVIILYVVYEYYILFLLMYAPGMCWIAFKTMFYNSPNFDRLVTRRGVSTANNISTSASASPNAKQAALKTAASEMKNGAENYSLCAWLGFWIYLAGFILWVIENSFCARLEHLHLHVLWHIGASVGLFFFVLTIEILHLELHGVSHNLVLLPLPRIVTTDPADDTKVVCKKKE